MRYSMVVALAAGNLVAAQQTPTPVAVSATPGAAGTPGTPTTPGGTPTSTPGGIGSLADWAYVGCLASENGFPDFSLVDSSDDNSVSTCAGKCEGSRYFATRDMDCYCGEDLDTETTSNVGSDKCDIACPGDPSQACGGNAGGTFRMARRQNIPASFLLSVYISVTAGENTATVTETVPGRLVTETATLTEADGSIETVTNTLIAVPTGVVIICYGDYCAPQNHCPVCTNWQVVCRDGSCCPEKCEGDDWDRLVICEGDNCKYSEGNCDQKITCNGDKCTWEEKHDEGQKMFSCNGDECHHESCSGDECGKKYLCDGDDCDEAIICKGDTCPVPTPNTPTPGHIVYVPEGGHHESGNEGGNEGGNESGNEGGNEGGNETGNEGGNEAGNEGGHSQSWVPHGDSCTGEGCPAAGTPTPVASGAGQKTVAGLAALLAGAIFAL